MFPIEPLLHMQIIALRPQNVAKNRYEPRTIESSVQKSARLTRQIIRLQYRQPFFLCIDNQLIFCEPPEIRDTDKTCGPEYGINEFFRWLTPKQFSVRLHPILPCFLMSKRVCPREKTAA